MYISHPHRVISLSQIINRNQARYRIRFSSQEELTDRNYWMKITSRRAKYARFEATVVDESPEENIEWLKKYSILYGLKYLFAAEKLNLETIPVRVLKYDDNLDISVVTEFFNADYLSLSAYEKGEFIDQLINRRSMRFTEISNKTGFSYNSLHTMYSAYKTARLYTPLEAAYKECRITASNVLRSKSFFDIIPLTRHQELTDFFIRNGNYAADKLKQAVKNRRQNISKTQAILNEINITEITDKPRTDKSISRISHIMMEDDLNLFKMDEQQLTEKMKTDKRFSKQILAYQTLRGRCRDAYNRLMAALPEELVLDFNTAVTLPDRTRFSYAVPARAKKICRNKTPKDINERRLFARIMEYIDKTNAYPEARDLLNKTFELYGKPEMQQLFSDFFKFCIFYRNIRKKIIAENPD